MASWAGVNVLALKRWDTADRGRTEASARPTETMDRPAAAAAATATPTCS